MTGVYKKTEMVGLPKDFRYNYPNPKPTNEMSAVYTLPPNPHPLDPADRLRWMLLIASALHAFLILGVGFVYSQKTSSPMPTAMEITLVHSHSEQAPEDADYLAQSNQRGGGNVREKMRSSSPLPNPRPVDDVSGKAAQTTPTAAPRQQQKELKILSAQQSSADQMDMPEKAVDTPTPPVEKPNADYLSIRSREIARLSAEIREHQQSFSQMPRQKYITANTREYIYASYEDSWRLKVERVGNLNYPAEVREQNLKGSLLLDVAINTDGSLQSVDVIRTSGNRILDEAAIRIVKRSAPFAPFTPEMKQNIDQLHIIRTWQFLNEHRLTSR